MKTATTLALLALTSSGQCPNKHSQYYQWVQTSKGIEIYVDQAASDDDWWVMLLVNKSSHYGISFVVVGPNKRVEDFAPIPRGDCCRIEIGKDEKVQIQ